MDVTALRVRADHALDPRYQRLMEVTREVARDGYDAVSMRDVADRSKLSLTTIYQFCRSKDQLIAEAHLDSMTEFGRRVLARRPRGTTATERVASVMRSYIKSLEVNETLSRTTMRAMYSLELDVHDARAVSGSLYSAMIEHAIGDEAIEDQRGATEALGHVVDSIIFSWLSGWRDLQWARRQLDQAVRVIIRPASNVRSAPRASRATAGRSSRN